MSEDFQATTGVKIPPSHPLMAWLVRHATWCLNRFCIRGDGRTAYYRIKGRPYNGEVVRFGEAVLWKDPDKAAHKLEGRFSEGFWLGKTIGADDHLVEIGGQVKRARTIQRVAPGRRWKGEALLKIQTTPWNGWRNSAIITRHGAS